MNPLSDRVVVVALIVTIGLIFALVFWTVRLAPPAGGPLQWRDGATQALLPSAHEAEFAPAGAAKKVQAG